VKTLSNSVTHADRPHVSVRDYRDRIRLVSIRPIAVGEELTIGWPQEAETEAIFARGVLHASTTMSGLLHGNGTNGGIPNGMGLKEGGLSASASQIQRVLETSNEELGSRRSIKVMKFPENGLVNSGLEEGKEGKFDKFDKAARPDRDMKGEKGGEKGGANEE